MTDSISFLLECVREKQFWGNKSAEKLGVFPTNWVPSGCPVSVRLSVCPLVFMENAAKNSSARDKKLDGARYWLFLPTLMSKNKHFMLNLRRHYSFQVKRLRVSYVHLLIFCIFCVYKHLVSIHPTDIFIEGSVYYPPDTIQPWMKKGLLLDL